VSPAPIQPRSQPCRQQRHLEQQFDGDQQFNRQQQRKFEQLQLLQQVELLQQLDELQLQLILEGCCRTGRSGRVAEDPCASSPVPR
jgi:hypothetical protein